MKIYILDTNVLFQWIASYLPSVEQANEKFTPNPEVNNHIRNFCENTSDRIYVPDLVWCEFLGGILHKDMDVSKDLANLKLWFFKRESYVQQIERVILTKHEFYFFPQGLSPYPDAQDIVRDFDLIDDKTFQWMRSGKDNTTKEKEKILDGMDSAIIVYANELAKEHPSDQIILLTADYRMMKIFPRIRSRHKEWFAQNTKAYYTKSPKSEENLWKRLR
ncbi:hypothetical protein WDW89_16920 [Deltaproteobacteria bacterium TL4]